MSNHNTPLNLSLLSLALIAFACNAEPDDTAGTATSSTGGSTGGSTGELACVEDDFAPSPFAGPGYAPDNGGLQEPLQDTYVVSTTFLQLRPDKQQEFEQSVGLMIPVLMSNPGLVGFSLAGSAKCGTARTLAVWRDEAAMMAFVMSDEHLAGVGKAGEYSSTGTVTSWEVPRGQIPVPWEVAAARVAEVAPVY